MEALSLLQFALPSALASVLLHSLWQDSLLALAAALTLSAMAGRSAASRHNVAMAFLLAMLLVPAAQLLDLWSVPARDSIVPAMTAPRLSGSASALVQESSILAPAVVVLWLLGVAFMLARHIAGLGALRAVERRPHEALPPAWQRRVEEIRAVLGIGRKVAVRLSDEVLSPFAARLVRPAIWLPLSILTRAPREQLEALLAHELAHIARKDWLWNGVQCVVESLLFFHPGVWWLSRRIRQEREHACDDLAVATCGDALVLAEALAALECDRQPSPRLVLAATGGSLVQRISRLLSAPPTRGHWGALAVTGALSVAGLLVVTQVGLLGGRFPELQVTASTRGLLGPGDFREIKAGGLDKQRYYRESIDSQGRLTRVYEEDGEPRPIDANVARWVASVSRMSEKPVAVPAPPSIEQMPEAKALVAAVAADPKVVERLGPSARPTSRPPNGNLRLSGAEGDADLNMEMRGPRGSAVVEIDAEMKDRRWTLNSIDLR